jgi:hypothetical protein
MAYALNYPNAAVDGRAQETTEAPKGFFARVLASIERTQMARFRRELKFYAPHLYEELVVNAEKHEGRSDAR